MRLLIVGATGGTGRELVARAMEAHGVRRLKSTRLDDRPSRGAD